VDAPLTADLWNDALALYAQMLDDSAATSFINAVASREPNIAAKIVADSYRDRAGGRDAGATAQAMRDAMKSFGHGLSRLARVDDGGEALPLLFKDLGNDRARWGWFDRHRDEITVGPVETDDSNGRFPYHIGRYVSWILEQAYKVDRLWPQAMVKEWIVREIDERLKMRDFPVSDPWYVAEHRWNDLKTAVGLAHSNNQDPIELHGMLRSIAHLPDEIVIWAPSNVSVDVGALRVYAKSEISAGTSTAHAPYPVGSRPFVNGMAPWSYFTEGEILARVQYAAVAALDIYQKICAEWLPGLASFLPLAALAPMKLTGYVWKANDQPVWDYALTPAEGPQNDVEIKLEPPPPDLPWFRAEDEDLRRRRPQFSRRFSAPAAHGSLDRDILGTWPARDLALRWMHWHLRNIGWSELIGI